MPERTGCCHGSRTIIIAALIARRHAVINSLELEGKSFFISRFLLKDEQTEIVSRTATSEAAAV